MKKIYILLSFCLIHFIAQAQTIPAYVPTNGLVGWWPFNGNANDESGNGNNGTVNGATLTSDRNGNVGKAYSFDGVNNSIVTNNFFNASQDFTLLIWSFNYNTNAGEILNTIPHPIIGVGENSIWAGPNSLSILYGNGLSGGWLNNGGNNYQFSNNTLNTWKYITISKNGFDWKVYHNSILLGQFTTYQQPSAQITQLVFGHCDPSVCNETYNGKLDDIAIYNRALTQQEITALYTSTPPCSLSISSQPTNQSSTTGSNVSFNVGVTTDCNNTTSYQWQTNTGFGWQTLQLAGQYTGLNTSTLHVSNVGSTNTNQLFRCLILSGNIADTTQTATLSVVNTGDTTLSAVTHAIPYQAVVRDGAGNPLINHPLTVRCTLHDNTASGTSIYQETHTITTNNLGLFTLHIGTGVASIGNIDSIHWALYKKYLQVEFDTTAQGVSYIDLGTQQLMAVPYALYAETAGNALNAPKGDDGVDGVNGSNGMNGVDGVDGATGPAGTGGFTHYIGEKFGGGVIFHLWKDTNGVEHGLVLSREDQGYSHYSNVFFTGIGTIGENQIDGEPNSDAIINQIGHTSSAAKLCLDYSSGIYNDWYLPSIGELKLIFDNIYEVNKTLMNSTLFSALNAETYWSSTEMEQSYSSAYALLCQNSTLFYYYVAGIGKSSSYKVRAIRKW